MNLLIEFVILLILGLASLRLLFSNPRTSKPAEDPKPNPTVAELLDIVQAYENYRENASRQPGYINDEEDPTRDYEAHLRLAATNAAMQLTALTGAPSPVERKESA